MKNLMNKICIILALTYVLSIFPVGIAFGTEEELPLSTGEMGLLEMLEVIPETDATYDSGITRGELVYMAAKICNATGSNPSGEKLFYDVTPEHKYYSSVYTMAEMGVVSGDGNGYFRPDDNATFEEACSIFSVILGYKKLGGHKSFITIANQAGITDGVKSSGVFTRGQAVQMAYNTLHSGMYEPVSYSGDSAIYELNEDYLAIERYHNLVMNKGIVNAAYGTSLTHPDNSCSEKEIGIDGKIYTYADNIGLLGKAVVFYTDSNDKQSRTEIKYLYEDDVENDILTISAESVESFSNGTLKYYKDDKAKTLKIEHTADVIYNGVAYPDYADSDFSNASGSVTLIDNNADGKYDVVVIEAFEYVIVKSTNTEDEIIYGKYPDVKIGSADGNVNMRLFRGDSLALISAVKADSVIAVKESKNTSGDKLIDVEILQLGTKGTVSEMYDEEITVDGVKYETVDNAVYDEDIKVGDTVSVFTHNGKCVAVTHGDDTVYKTGYLVDVAKSDDAFTSTLKIKMIDQNRKMNTFDCSEKIKIDETVVKDVNTAMNMLSSSASHSNASSTWKYSQLIRYRVNNEGILTHIDTNNYNSAVESENSLKMDVAKSTLMYYDVNASFYETGNDGELVASSPGAITDIWVVPTEQRDQEEWYGKTLGRSTYVTEVYNVDSDSMVADTVVVYINKVTQVSNSAVPLVVTDVSDVLASDGDTVRCVTTVGANATPRAYNLADSLSNYDVKKGDVIRIRTNYLNEIEFIDKWYSFGSQPSESDRVKTASYSTDLSALESQVRMACGTALSAKDGFVTHTTSMTSDLNGVAQKSFFNNYLVLAGTRFYLYDLTSREPEVTSVSVNDIVTYDQNPDNPDMVFVATQTGNLRFVYIVRG